MIFYDIEIKNKVYEKTQEILDKIFRFTFSSQSVLKNYKEIISSIYSLKIFPYRYSKYNEKYRVLNIKGKYIIFYRINEVTKIVTIVYIFSTKEDYEFLVK